MKDLHNGGCTVIDNATGAVQYTEKRTLVTDEFDTVDYHLDLFKNNFVKVFTQPYQILKENLPKPEFNLLYALIPYIEYKTCALVDGKTSNKHYMTRKEIADKLNLEYKYCSKIIKCLIDKGFLAYIVQINNYTNMRTKCYVVNPYICVNGDKPEIDIIKIFYEIDYWKTLLLK